METIPISVVIPKGVLLPGDLCHRLGIEDYKEMPPDKLYLIGFREVTDSVEEIRAMIEKAVHGIEVVVSDVVN